MKLAICDSGKFIFYFFVQIRRREEIVNAADRVASGMVNGQVGKTGNGNLVFSGNAPRKGIEDKGK